MAKKPGPIDTKLVHAGRRPDWTHGVVNPPVYHASTCLFDTVAEFEAAVKNPNAGLYYGRRGTPTQWALQEALIETEPGAAGCRLTPSGVSAIAAALLGVLKSGDHLLVTDSAYEPTRSICDGLLKSQGIETEYFDPMIGSEISRLIKPNTKAVFCESPGSLTFEVQDIPAISAAAKAAGAVVIIDNTWATGLYFNPFDHGVDISIQALTKYVVGHSDAMMGCVMATERYWPRVERSVFQLGLCVGPDDAYLGLRGLRTLSVRLKQHEASAMRVAEFLWAHQHVDTVLHPALESCPGQALWRRDFKGSTGLFSFVLKAGDPALLNHFIDDMQHFKIGFSWGGYESLILPARLTGTRTATTPNFPGPLLRLHIGLEDPEDLIADLGEALERYHNAH
ncbi:MAG: cystathionine beta-lyase [Pseudomonadota bacterium]